MKGNCYHYNKPRHYKSNYSKLKKVKNTEEVHLVNYLNVNEQPKFVNSTWVTDPVPALKHTLQRSFEEKSDTVFSMKEIEDFEKMLDELKVAEISQYSLISLIIANVSNFKMVKLY